MPYDDGGDDKQAQTDADLQSSWMSKIAEAEKGQRPFRDFVKKVNRRLAINHTESETRGRGRRLNIAWANLEILKPSAFARPPKVVVATRNDSRDQLVAAASSVLELATNTNNDLCGVFDALVSLRDDYLRYARGCAWIRYEPTLEEVEAETPAPDDGAPQADGQAMARPVDPAARGIGDNGGPEMEPRERLTDERVYVDYVSWDKFGHNQAAVWGEVEFVYRMVPMTKAAFEKRWKDRVKDVTFGEAKRNDDTGQKAADTTLVIECWCKESRKVYWLSKQCKTPLEVGPPPIEFKNFWPCPRPAYGTTLDRSLTPKPDLMFYEDQLSEIDDLTKRIGALQQSLKVKGFYSQGAAKDGSQAIEAAILSNEDRAIMVPVPGWAAMSDKKDLGIVWLPIDIVIQVITACIANRKEMIQNVYEVTGISDIMRGSSEASETLGAQQLKSQYGSVRVREKQAEMARVARDACAMVGEVIAEHFEPEQLMRMTSTQIPPEVITLLRDDKMRNFLIDIETDSTIVPDEEVEKKSRIEFATTVGGMIEQGAPIAAQSPPLAKLMGEVIKYVAQGFRAGRPLEQAIDEAMNGAAQQVAAKASQPPPPDPKMVQVQARQQHDTATLAFEQQKHTDNMALETQKMALDHEHKMRVATMAHEFKREGLISGEMLKREDMGRQAQQAQRDQAATEQQDAGDAQIAATLDGIMKQLAALTDAQAQQADALQKVAQAVMPQQSEPAPA